MKGGTILTKLFLVLLAIINCQGRFDRTCGGGHCIFKPKESDAMAYLSCTPDNRCACDHYRYIADVPAWRLEFSNGKCNIDISGPCGEDDGLEIGCKVGHECIKGRCRDPSNLRTRPLNHSCTDDIDCQPELVCKAAEFYFHIIKRCVTPETPAYDPAVGYPPPTPPKPNSGR